MDSSAPAAELSPESPTVESVLVPLTNGGSHREPPPMIPAPSKTFKINRSLSNNALESEVEGFHDSDTEDDSSGSELEYEAIIKRLETTSLEEQKQRKLQRRESKRKEVDLDHQTPSPVIISPFGSSAAAGEDHLRSNMTSSPGPQQQLPTQALIDEKLGGKELIEYTRQQNELKYGKMFKIAESKEEEKKPILKARKSLSMVNPMKFLMHDDKDKEAEKDKDSPKEKEKEKDSSKEVKDRENSSKQSSRSPSDDEDQQLLEADEKIIPELVEFTEKENRTKYKSMIPIKKIDEDVLSITSIKITGYDKRFEPTKYYVRIPSSFLSFSLSLFLSFSF